MSGKGVLPMDSYRLAQYSVQVPCFVCEGGNSFDTELCRHCQAPLALAHQASVQKTIPQLVATIGSADAGKTVYLGMLTDMLSRRNDALQLLARCVLRNAAANHDGFTFNMRVSGQDAE